MMSQKISVLFQDDDALHSVSLDDINSLVEQYPFSQILQVLRARKLVLSNLPVGQYLHEISLSSSDPLRLTRQLDELGRKESIVEAEAPATSVNVEQDDHVDEMNAIDSLEEEIASDWTYGSLDEQWNNEESTSWDFDITFEEDDMQLWLLDEPDEIDLDDDDFEDSELTEGALIDLDDIPVTELIYEPFDEEIIDWNKSIDAEDEFDDFDESDDYLETVDDLLAAADLEEDDADDDIIPEFNEDFDFPQTEVKQELESTVQINIQPSDVVINDMGNEEENERVSDKIEHSSPKKEETGQSVRSSKYVGNAFVDWLHTLPAMAGSEVQGLDEEVEEDLWEEDDAEDMPKKHKKKKKKGKKDKKGVDTLFEDSLELDDDILSESLADLLAHHGHTKKAKKMYKKLRLKFPEKSDYFAAKINQLKD